MKLLQTMALSALLITAGPAFADKTAGQMVDDSVIQAEVKAKIMSDDFVAGGWDINLETRKGVVQLGGFIDDPEKGKLAAERAASVEGVVKVDNYEFQQGSDYNRTIRASANLIYNPTANVQLGLEFLWGERKNRDGSKGTASQLQFAARYSF